VIRCGEWLIGERYRIARIQRPDGGMNYCVWDWDEYELIAVFDNRDASIAAVPTPQ
jgi:hypothetical protein